MTDCNTCGIATLDICVQDNEDWVRQFEMRDRREIIDLTGWLIEMQIGDGYETAPLLAVDSAGSTGNGSTIEIADASAGVFEVRIKQADLDLLAIPTGSRQKVFRYDMRFSDPVPLTSVLIRGEFKAQRGVTV